MPSRYSVIAAPYKATWQPTYVILDLEHWAYCALPDDGDPSTLLPLEWKHRAAAEAWLNQCYRAWDRGTVPAPKNWRPLRDTPSPWETPANPDRVDLNDAFALWNE